jgi:hypothetical protein
VIYSVIEKTTFSENLNPAITRDRNTNDVAGPFLDLIQEAKLIDSLNSVNNPAVMEYNYEH